MNDAEEPTGRAKGGKARSDKLTPAEKSKIGASGARARWDETIPEATHIGELKIGELVLPCAVLADGTRVISQGGIASAFGPVTGGWQTRKKATSEHAGDLPPFLVAASLSPFISNDLRTLVSTPIRYRDPRGGPIRVGIDATLIPQVCEVWLQARDKLALTKIQVPVADRADLLMRGLAHTGIIALVDEATGFQKDRARDALAKILEAFVAKELQPWVKTFPGEYYEQLFRLRGLDYPNATVQRPQYFGVLTNDIIYKRIAPGVLEELKHVADRNEQGRPKHKYFQKLTNNIGYPKLREHLGSVVTLMKLSDGYGDFKDKLDRIHPPFGKTLPLALNVASVDEDDDGKGI
jgi:hypothetical protein